MIDTRDESPIDLDLVEGKRLQQRQRRTAGAEIIHGDLDAERLQEPQNRQRAGRVVDGDAFGDLKLEPAGCQAGLQQDCAH